MADDYGATGIPETFFVDARGRVVGHVIGVVPLPSSRRASEPRSLARVAGTVTGGRSFDVQ